MLRIYFRGYTATAPLKRVVLRTDVLKTRNFRGYTATAPLKLWF